MDSSNAGDCEGLCLSCQSLHKKAAQTWYGAQHLDRQTENRSGSFLAIVDTMKSHFRYDSQQISYKPNACLDPKTFPQVLRGKTGTTKSGEPSSNTSSMIAWGLTDIQKNISSKTSLAYADIKKVHDDRDAKKGCRIWFSNFHVSGVYQNVRIEKSSYGAPEPR